MDINKIYDKPELKLGVIVKEVKELFAAS